MVVSGLSPGDVNGLKGMFIDYKRVEYVVVRWRNNGREWVVRMPNNV